MIPTPRLAGLKSTLERSREVTIITHRKPDGDAIGSSLGLGLLLERHDIHVTYICADSVPTHYQFLEGSDRFQTNLPEKSELVVILDCGRDAMTGFTTEQLKAVGPLVDIDHHPKPSRPESIRLAVYDTHASSAAEIVFEISEAFEWPLDRPAATALLTGLFTDTSAFQNTNTTARTLHIAAQLMRSGARLKTIIKECFYSSTVPKLKLWGTAMSRIEETEPGIVATVVTSDDLRESGATPDDIEGLVNFLNTIPGVPALMLLTDLGHGEVKGSLRTRDPEVDVAKLAGELGGGGHTKAAGFSVPGRLERDGDTSWQIVPPS